MQVPGVATDGPGKREKILGGHVPLPYFPRLWLATFFYYFNLNKSVNRINANFFSHLNLFVVSADLQKRKMKIKWLYSAL